MRVLVICISLLFFFGEKGVAQQPKQVSGINKFLTPADTLSKPRLTGVGITTAAGFTGMMLVLDQAWYDQFDQEAFHFYNDNAEWLQMDKAGHAWTTYHGARLGHAMLLWAGVDDKKATIYGSQLGLVFMTGVEVLDGFSSGWGFSPGDMGANVFGTGLFMGQELLWEEQRIGLKYSFEPVSYLDDPQVAARVDDLYGQGIGRLLEDYNAQTYWLTINPASFMEESSNFPKWINIAAGYSGADMLGGRSNFWCDDTDIDPEDCPLGQRIDFTDEVQRYRQYYLSFDVDLTQIETRSKLLKTVFGAMNMVKIPAPTLEIDSRGEVNFRALR